MRRALFLFGALLSAAGLAQPPAADPVSGEREPRWFSLEESRDDIRRLLGAPTVTAGFGAGFESWQYQIGDIDHHEFSHQLVFRSGGALVSVTRNYEDARDVDVLFPAGVTRACHFPDAAKTRFSARARRLSGRRVLMAMGVAEPGQRTNQLVLIRESELRIFFPWVAAQLGDGAEK